MTLRKVKTAASLFVVLLVIAIPVSAEPMLIHGTTDAAELISHLVDTSSVTVGSSILFGFSGEDDYDDKIQAFQSGWFEPQLGNTTTDIFTTGIILSSGSANNIQNPNTRDEETLESPAPNSGDYTKAWRTSGANVLQQFTDPLEAPYLADALRKLTSALGVNEIYDPNVLQFHFTLDPGDWNLRFRYVFGSDEYVNYVNSQFNDAIGLFIDGINVVTLSNGAIISVNNINPLLNSDHYVNNILYNPDKNDLSKDQIVPNPYMDVSLDGLTDTLTSTITLQGGTENERIDHVATLIIGDINSNNAPDYDVDSAVFIEGGSFKAVPAVPEPGTLFLLGTGLAAAGLLRRRIR
jgi:hypothetical protein